MPTNIRRVNWIMPLKQLKALMYFPQEIRHVPRILGNAGIRLVIVERLPGTRIDGAAFWLDDGPVIALSVRYDRIDISGSHSYMK